MERKKIRANEEGEIAGTSRKSEGNQNFFYDFQWRDNVKGKWRGPEGGHGLAYPFSRPWL